MITNKIKKTQTRILIKLVFQKPNKLAELEKNLTQQILFHNRLNKIFKNNNNNLNKQALKKKIVEFLTKINYLN